MTSRTLLRAAAFSFALIAGATSARAQAPPVAAPTPQPAVIKPGDNLVTDGMPEIPASLAEEVRRYTEFRSAATSPSGTRRGERC